MQVGFGWTIVGDDVEVTVGVTEEEEEEAELDFVVGDFEVSVGLAVLLGVRVVDAFVGVGSLLDVWVVLLMALEKKFVLV